MIVNVLRQGTLSHPEWFYRMLEILTVGVFASVLIAIVFFIIMQLRKEDKDNE